VWRFLIRLDDQILQAVLTGWLRARSDTSAPAGPPRRRRVVIAVDGKAVCGARLADGRQMHLLSAYDTATGVVLAQLTIAAKSNEIPAFTPLLDQVKAILGSLNGVLVVTDALHAQVGHATDLHARGAHPLVRVNGNQPTVLQQLKTLPWAQVSIGHRSNERGHGRRETRTTKAVTVDTPHGLGFPHAAQAVRITRTRTMCGKTTRETAHLIVTLPAEQAQPADLADWHDASGTSRTNFTGSATSPSTKTPTKPAPATDPPSQPSYATPPSATTASTAKPTSPAPPAAPAIGPTPSSPRSPAATRQRNDPGTTDRRVDPLAVTLHSALSAAEACVG
jgi:hypothetical protein